jgi:hypothetical protein
VDSLSNAYLSIRNFTEGGIDGCEIEDDIIIQRQSGTFSSRVWKFFTAPTDSEKERAIIEKLMALILVADCAYMQHLIQEIDFQRQVQTIKNEALKEAFQEFLKAHLCIETPSGSVEKVHSSPTVYIV